MNTLLLPGSLWPRGAGVKPYAALKPSPLTDALARGQIEPCELRCWSSALMFALTGQRVDAPFAAVAARNAQLDSANDEGVTWLRADPAYFEVGREDVALATLADFALTQIEADALVKSLNDHFAPDGIVLTALSPKQWVARMPGTLTIDSVDPWAAMRVPARYVPMQGADARRVRKFLTEAQMLLHAHPVNAAREARNERSVNGLACWASGTLKNAQFVPTPQMLSTSCKQARALGEALALKNMQNSVHVGYFPDAMASLLAGDAARWCENFSKTLSENYATFAQSPCDVIVGGQRPVARVRVSPTSGWKSTVGKLFSRGADPAITLSALAEHDA
jgi:hypothetical protein